MTDHAFDADYWEQHWAHRATPGESPAHPYLAVELGDLEPGTALDAGCGAGAEALWLVEHGWQVTAADISAEALARAAARATGSTAADRVQWLQADLGSWTPDGRFDLVTTHYAHPAMPQLDFYDRIADWVAPGGTLLIVGHLHGHGSAAHGSGPGHGPGHGDDEHPPAHATTTAAAVTARLTGGWDVVTAVEPHRTVDVPGGRSVSLDDVVVRATRRS
jgi:SAM-dependent methyltransferase